MHHVHLFLHDKRVLRGGISYERNNKTCCLYRPFRCRCCSHRERAFQELAGYGRTGCPFRCPWYEGRADYTEVELPNAKRVAGEVFVLPVHPTLERRDLQDMVTAVEKVLAAYGSP